MKSGLKGLKKAEIIERYEYLQGEYEDLQGEYEDLQQQYADLDECYAELEQLNSENEEKTPDIIEEVLKEFRFDTDLQEKLFTVYKKNFLDELDKLAGLYCIDTQIIFTELQKEKRPKGLDNEIYETLEESIENFRRFKN